MLEVALRRGQQHGMVFWLYDEDNWPSGPAGMKTWEDHPEYIMNYLYLERKVIVESRQTVNVCLPPRRELVVTTPIDAAIVSCCHRR